ncbi:glycoside hydrolase family 3 N-terminal domain-containing protein [Brachyspira hampsonii]|uniref:Beta-glucosidase n=1 Tax=Brachyspira hampsonii TaxID=1287055 RepID=A0AAC9XJR9_9SPIR|nr:glycoside hydrolase family 3 N-terminal domain-containing protein [Brachyspira hampsonii]ASJ20518.1 beta-glucosidase [Brachyspira hampsonii]ELV05903.1 glycoside hydrolase family 3 domain-containing protein [Brachyspira hampsonii 30599]MBW5379528.1 beta-glucosidase [Brachyspira hampsonii]MBW5409500.1 beta-glucosidase [Brachyspira hampsonii]OEJ18298.1 hypothetical protein A9496_07510 [Brachyspira hampsonii]
MIYKDKTKPISERVKDLISQMTIEEKAYQLTSVWSYEITKKDFTFDIDKLKNKFPYGLGQITRIGGGTPTKVQNIPKFRNEVQEYFMNNTRLQIPVMFHEESCSGAMFDGTTNFPQAIGVAATFNDTLCEEMADIIGKELNAVGCNQTLAPLLDVTREPRWGRLEETFGEDVYLVSQMGMAYIRGIQKNNIYSTGKHFVAYGAAEKGFNWAPGQVPERTLREVYLAAFEAAIKEANLKSIMPAYQENDGEPCHSSKKLLKTILRDEWKFDGLVVTDYSGLTLLESFHKLFPDYNSIAKRAIDCEVDIELPTQAVYGKILVEEVKNENILEKNLDKIVERVLTKKFELGLFDNPYIPETISFVMRSNESLHKSLELARESIVLLENKNNILPLKKDQKVAIIGPNGNSVRNQLGDYAFKAHVESLVETLRVMSNNEDNNNATGFTMQERVDLDANILYNFIREIEGVSVYEGVCSKIGKDNVFLSLGSEIFETTDELVNEAVETAKKSDVILAILGDKSGLEDGTSSGESRDRSSLNLLPGQNKLLKELKKLGKPIILILIVGRPVTMPWERENMDGIICAWLPGEMGGQAIADVLYGDYNPGGKLPVTFPHNIGQIPIYYSHKPSGGSERMWGGYVDGPHEAIYNFGYGLSYTNFELYDFKVDKKELSPTDKINISCKIKNVGKVKGSEVVQLYFRNNVLGVTRPVKELKGFKRVTLEPNQSVGINFEVPIHILAFYDEDMKFVMKKANVDILLGVSSDNILFKETILVNKDEEIKEKVFTTKVNLL